MLHVPVVPSPIFSLSAAFRPLCTQYGDYPKTPVLKPVLCAEIFSKPILVFLLCGLPKILLLGKFSYRQIVGAPSPMLLFLLCTRILLCTPFLLFALFFLYSLPILCPLLLDTLCSFLHFPLVWYIPLLSCSPYSFCTPCFFCALCSFYTHCFLYALSLFMRPGLPYGIPLPSHTLLLFCMPSLGIPYPFLCALFPPYCLPLSLHTLSLFARPVLSLRHSPFSKLF